MKSFSFIRISPFLRLSCTKPYSHMLISPSKIFPHTRNHESACNIKRKWKTSMSERECWASLSVAFPNVITWKFSRLTLFVLFWCFHLMLRCFSLSLPHLFDINWPFCFFPFVNWKLPTLNHFSAFYNSLIISLDTYIHWFFGPFMVDWISANWSDVIELYNNFYGLIIHEKTTMWVGGRCFSQFNNNGGDDMSKNEDETMWVMEKEA
jgi:hypothetical protein